MLTFSKEAALSFVAACESLEELARASPYTIRANILIGCSTVPTMRK